MNSTDIIAIAAIVLIVGLAVFYIVRAKKRGQKCIGCPYAKQCAKRMNSDHGGHCGKNG